VLMDPSKAMQELGLPQHHIRFTSNLSIDSSGPPAVALDSITLLLRQKLASERVQQSPDGSISVSDSVVIKVTPGHDEENKTAHVSWNIQDEELGSSVLELLKTQLSRR